MKEPKLDVMSIDTFINEVREGDAIAHGFVLGTSSGDVKSCTFACKSLDDFSPDDFFPVEPSNESVLTSVLDLLRKTEGSELIGAFALKESRGKASFVLSLFDYFDDLPEKVGGVSRENFERRIHEKILSCAVEYYTRNALCRCRVHCARVYYGYIVFFWTNNVAEM